MMTMRPQRWAAFEDDSHGALAVFQESLPVFLIATARRDFSSCRPGETISVVIERNHADGYDFLPVLGPGTDDEAVVGVLEVAHIRDGVTPEATVRQYLQPLGEQHLIGADASILTFIRDADRHPFRFVVSGHHISGLVTLSDLQRLPVRAALFAMVTHLEMVMADVIRHRFAHEDDWIELLDNEGRNRRVRKQIARAKSADTFVDPLLSTLLRDKATIIATVWSCPEEVSMNKTRFEEDMEKITDLRNDLAHAKNYAATRDAARHVCECVRRMDGWIKCLAEWGAGQTRPDPRILSERD